MTKTKDFNLKFRPPSQRDDKDKMLEFVFRKAERSQKEAKQYKAQVKELESEIKAGSKPKLKKQREKATEETRKQVFEASNDLQLDEKATRRLIDDYLRDAGWEADSQVAKILKGIRVDLRKIGSKAIAEWPTDNGPADYALFYGMKLLAVVEAKRKELMLNYPLEQSKRYSKGIQQPDSEEILGDWKGYKTPFIFSTNHRLSTSARLSKKMPLKALKMTQRALTHIGSYGNWNRKTRTCIGLAYRLIKSKRATS